MINFAQVYRLLFTALGGTARFIADNANTFLIGGGGGAGSTTMSIIPWLAAQNANASGVTPAGFSTSTATGIRALDTTTEYATTITAGSTANVNIGSVSTLAGDTTVNAIRLTSATIGNLGAGRKLTVTSGGIFFSANTGGIGAAGNAAAGTVNFNAAEGIVWVNGTNANSIGAVIDGSGGLTKAGTGTLTISGANIYTGSTMVSSGTLTAGAVNTLPSGTAVVLSNIAADDADAPSVTSFTALDLNGFNQTVGSVSGSGTYVGNISLGSATLTTGGSNASTTYGGIISGAGGLTKAGTGTFTLTDTNTYGGTTTVSTGTLLVSGAGSVK